MAPDHFFSHLTAAELLGLRLPEGFRPGELDVSVAPPSRASRAVGVRGRQLSLQFPTTLSTGFRTSAPLDTWLMLGDTLSTDELTIMGDGLLRRIGPETSAVGLASAVRAMSGKRGHRRLRAALANIRPGTDSSRETMLRLLVVRSGFPEPEVNGVILNRFGAEIAHGDLVFRQYRTILEYDGAHHREDERQFNIDIARLDELMEEDWRVIRVNRDLMHRRAALLGKIETALAKHGWRPSVA